jgi:hypothetical protein
MIDGDGLMVVSGFTVAAGWIDVWRGTFTNNSYRNRG